MNGYDTRITEVIFGILIVLILISIVGSFKKEEPLNNHQSDDGYYQYNSGDNDNIYAP